MAAINGTLGAVTYASGYTTNCYQWDAEDTTEILDVTPFSPADDYRTNISGLKQWTGTYTCYIDATTALPVSGTTGAATFQAHTGRTWSGTIRVGSVRISVAVDGSQRSLVVGFSGSGKCTPA